MPSNHRQPRPLLFIKETVKFTVTCCVCINYKKEGDTASFNLLCIEVKWTHTVLFQHFVSILLKNDCFFHSVWAFFRQCYECLPENVVVELVVTCHWNHRAKCYSKWVKHLASCIKPNLWYRQRRAEDWYEYGFIWFGFEGHGNVFSL